MHVASKNFALSVRFGLSAFQTSYYDFIFIMCVSGDNRPASEVARGAATEVLTTDLSRRQQEEVWRQARHRHLFTIQELDQGTSL